MEISCQLEIIIESDSFIVLFNAKEIVSTMWMKLSVARRTLVATLKWDVGRSVTMETEELEMAVLLTVNE